MSCCPPGVMSTSGNGGGGGPRLQVSSQVLGAGKGAGEAIASSPLRSAHLPQARPATPGAGHTQAWLPAPPLPISLSFTNQPRSPRPSSTRGAPASAQSVLLGPGGCLPRPHSCPGHNAKERARFNAGGRGVCWHGVGTGGGLASYPVRLPGEERKQKTSPCCCRDNEPPQPPTFPLLLLLSLAPQPLG